MTRIYRADLERIAHAGMRAGHHLDQWGDDVWALTLDWQTPLTAAATEPGRGSGPSDPTGTAAIRDDELRDAHRRVKAAIAAYEDAADELYLLLERYRPMTEKERKKAGARVNQVPDCTICTELALPRPRRGMCEKCYRRYGYHPGSTFDIRRLHDQETAQSA